MSTFLLAAPCPSLITQDSRNSVQEIMYLPDLSGRTSLLLDYCSDEPCVREQDAQGSFSIFNLFTILIWKCEIFGGMESY